MDTIEKIMVILGTIVFLSLFLSLPVLWLWNWLMPDIFNLPQITFWQALGLNLLSSFLLRSSSSGSK